IPQQHPPVADLASTLAIPKPPAASAIEYSKKAAKEATVFGPAAQSQFSTMPGVPLNMSASSPFSAAVITNVSGQGVALLGDWDGQEDLVADHAGLVNTLVSPGVNLTRAAISEHTMANGFPEDVFYYGDSVGNLYVVSTTSVTTNPPAPTPLVLNLPTVLNAFGTLNTDSQIVITGIAVSPVCDLSSFPNVNSGFSAFNGLIGEIVYVTYTDTGGGLRLSFDGQLMRSGLLAFPVADVASPAKAAPGIQSDTGFPVTVGGSFGVAFSTFSNLAGVAVDDDGDIYIQQVDLLQLTGANIVKITDVGTNRDRSAANSGFLTLTTLNPLNGQYGTASGPTAQASKGTNYSGTSTTWGNIVALAAGHGNVLYAALSRSYVATDNADTQKTEGLFPNPGALGATPSMIISFADAAGAFDTCSNGTNPGIYPRGDGIAEVAASGLTINPGVNNFRVFAYGDGPDKRGAAGSSSPVLGTVADTLKLSFQVDYTIDSGLAVDEENSVYVVSGGTPAGAPGRDPSPLLGEVLLFPDSSPADRRADSIDLRGDVVPTPPSAANVGDGDSDRYDHIFWQAPVDLTAGATPERISGLARGFLLYLNRTRTADNTPTLPNGRAQFDDDTSGVINFEDLDPGHQVAGGDDQSFPFTGDNTDGAGSPILSSPLQGGFEFLFPTSTGGTSVVN
ncbi:MAG TPA: hypothetical protein VKH35_00205, partial [Thermoanaerobaculia bacterium]|nr:hypothetical protein [Thermoanaerobaculia bacterium]